MDTKLTIEEVQLAIAGYYGITASWQGFRKGVEGCAFIATNVSFGLLQHEADMLVVSKSGYLTEVEIKRSYSDFLSDFHKPHFHEDERIKELVFAVPTSIVEKVVKKLAVETTVNYIFSYGEDGGVNKLQVRPYPQHKQCRKLFIEEQLQLARLASMRVWGLKDKLVKLRRRPLYFDEILEYNDDTAITTKNL